MAQDPQHEIDLHGTKYTRYPGLLAQAHGRIKKIDTEIVQFPNEENRWTTVVKATVTDIEDREFSAHGDANPENVGNKQIAKHSIRMAETRAKGRAFRDMLGLDVVLEGEDESGGDLGSGRASAARETPAYARSRQDSDTPREPPPREHPPKSNENVRSLRGGAKNATAPDPEAARKTQKDLISMMVGTIWPKNTEAALQKCLKEKDSLDDLTREDAEALIDWLEPKMPETQGETDVDDLLEEVDD